MTTSIMLEQESKATPEADRILTESELDAVTGGCVLVEPGPKGNPVPVSN